MFARLPASEDAKTEFAALMQSLVVAAGQLDRVASLRAEEFPACAAIISAALGALPRFDAMVDDLRA